MNIRSLEPRDIERIRKIHDQFYKEEFDFPDFFNNFLCAFIIENDKNEIVSVGGVHTIAESIIMTDKHFPIKTKVNALLKVLEASSFVASRSGYDQLHAFIQDSSWAKHLRSNGFIDCKGQAVYLNL